MKRMFLCKFIRKYAWYTELLYTGDNYLTLIHTGVVNAALPNFEGKFLKNILSINALKK
jgi:hypothetical protein